MNSDIKGMKKLQNKGTGETVEMRGIGTNEDGKLVFNYRKGNKIYFRHYNSLADFNEEWEDYEEPKRGWYLNSLGSTIENAFGDDGFGKELESIGNYFETEDEAKKAVEKLKALKRLKDNGFEFTGWERDVIYSGDFTITATDQTSCDDKDLDLLFGGKE